MAFDPITAILEVANTILDRVVPDKVANAQAKANLLEMQVKGELDNAAQQLEVDKAEAGSQSIFVAGWRPAVGWTCAGAFAYTYILQPFLTFFVAAIKHPVTLPPLNLSDMMPVLLGMLGFGALRSWDKQNGSGNGH